MQRIYGVLTFLFITFSSFTVQAETEYVIGLTQQSLRSASVEEVENGFNYQLKDIGKGKDYSMKIKTYPNSGQIVNLLENRKIVGYFGSTKLFIDNQSLFNPDLLLTPVLTDNVMQRYILLVRKDSGIDNIAKLKNTSISYCEADEVGMMYLRKLLKDNNIIDINTFFSKLVIKKNPNLDISAVFFKETKASLVLEADFQVAAELNPQLKQQLVVLKTSPEYIVGLFAVLNNIDGPMTNAELEKNVMSLGNAIQSKSLMKSYHYGAIRKIKLEDLNSVRELIDSLKEIKGKPK